MPSVASDLSDDFAQVVEKYRKSQGLSRVELATKSHLHQTYIGLLERGERSPNLDTANAIAKALGVRLSKLIIESEKIQEAKKRR